MTASDLIVALPWLAFAVVLVAVLVLLTRDR